MMKGQRTSLLVLEEEEEEENDLSDLDEPAPSCTGTSHDSTDIYNSSHHHHHHHQHPPEQYPNHKSPPRRRALNLLERAISSRLVTFFTCQDSTAQAYFQDAIQEKAPVAVVRTMRQFPHQSRMQRMGISSLNEMAKDSWAAKEKVVQAMGVEVILKAMRLHPKDCGVHQVACQCLYTLTAGDIPKILMEKGVVAAILQTMIHHSDDEDVLPPACDCLLALTDKKDSTALEMLRSRLGGVELAKLEHKYRGKNGEISKKAGEILKRLYV
mmetsp:Transcript_26505/g.64596  ORF Transcript_26505/g.64596 Transcript_26505/m.64596 type:complete len:269 (+) Transcript_26505:237-1043(+)